MALCPIFGYVFNINNSVPLVINFAALNQLLIEIFAQLALRIQITGDYLNIHH